MCNKKICECKFTTEENLTSDDEDEQLDSDDNYHSEFSSDEGASESDADSATGNRVTPEMIVWLMLKERGIISQRRYDRKADLSEDDIKPLIPKLNKPVSESSDERETNSNEAAQSETNQTSKNANENGAREENTNASEDNGEGTTMPQEESQGNTEKISKEKANENMTRLQTSMETDAKKMISKEKQQEALTSQHVNEVFEKEVEYTVPKCLKCCNISNTEITKDGNSHDENNVVTRENNKNLLNEDVVEPKEINKNDLQQNTKIEAASTNTEESQNSKPKSVNESNPATCKKTKSFQFILEHLVKEKRISCEHEYVVLETYVEDLDRHYRNNKATDMFHKPSSELKEFALFLNFYSPSSYKYIVENFNTPLPDHKVLCSWYVKDGERPGLSERAFDILKQKASKKRLICALMSRDIFMKNYGLDCDYDQVDYGGGCNFEYPDKAAMTFVFMLVSLDEDWKIPIGYIFAKRIPPETHAELIRVCLTQCHESGVDVVAVTLDSPTPAEFLGCSFQDVNNLKTVFKHPVCDSEVAVWIDPCLAIRSARHTLNAKRVLHDDGGNKILWKLIRKLWYLNFGLIWFQNIDFEQPKFLQFRNHIAKFGLTTEIFSDSLASALELAEELFPRLFRDTAATRRYIEIVNTLYDILNSTVTSNINDVMQKLNTAKDYMIALFSNQENALSPYDEENLTNTRLQFRSFVEGKPSCGFIGFLISIESFKHLYLTLVEKEQRLDCLNTHRLSKDHVENFVMNIRAFTGIEPEDFHSAEFYLFYSCLFEYLEQNPNFSDKNVTLEHWTMKNKCSPAVTIKRTSGKRAFDEVYSFNYRPKKLPRTTHSDEATYLVKEYSKALDTETDLLTRKHMVAYLAGWIATKFAKCLKCEVCIDLMCTDKKQWFHKFITSEKLKGICRPSEEVFRICWECERALRFQTSPAHLRAWVLRRLQFPWFTRTARHHQHHHIHLARAIITKYIPMRVPALLTPRETQRVTEMFSVFNQLFTDGLSMTIDVSDDQED